MQGVYALLIVLHRDLQISIGALGTRSFIPGSYVYVGSAQKGLDKRIQRHLGNNKKRFWHIDYLLTEAGARVQRVLYKQAPRETECETATEMLRHGTPIVGFGSSDCRCKSHLLRVSEGKVEEVLSDWLEFTQ